MSDENGSRSLLLRLMTPLRMCVSVHPGPVDVEIVVILKQHDFEHTPVLDVPGTVRTSYLEQLLAAGAPLSPDDPAITKILLDAGTELEQALETVAVENAVLVVHNGSLAGLLTLSDLNKHALRSVLYAFFANLEVDLAETISRLCPDPWEWIPQLPEDQQVHVIGYWEVTKRKGVDIGPLAGCTLTQLLKTIASIEKLRQEFGFKNRKAAEEVCGSLPMLRNSVMHPVRPLVTKPEDVQQIVRSIRNLNHLTGTLAAKKTATSMGCP